MHSVPKRLLLSCKALHSPNNIDFKLNWRYCRFDAIWLVLLLQGLQIGIDYL